MNEEIKRVSTACAQVANAASKLAEAVERMAEAEPEPAATPFTADVRDRGAVLLPKGFETGGKSFEGWVLMDTGEWRHDRNLHGISHCLGRARFAVPADSEIARINNVGFGPLPAGEEWHNPAGLTPARVDVASGWRLLLRSEVRDRDICPNIELWLGDNEQWDASAWRGAAPQETYRVDRTRCPFHWDRLKPEPTAIEKCIANPRCGDVVQGKFFGGIYFRDSREWHYAASDGRLEAVDSPMGNAPTSATSSTASYP